MCHNTLHNFFLCQLFMVQLASDLSLIDHIGPVAGTDDLRHLGRNHNDCFAFPCEPGDQRMDLGLCADVNAEYKFLAVSIAS